MKPILHSQTHEWRERSAEGRLRVVRAQWNSRKWTFTETFKDIPDWLEVPSPTLGDYEALRDVLWRKYQRKRLPWHFIQELDDKIGEMRGGAAEAG